MRDRSQAVELGGDSEGCRTVICGSCGGRGSCVLEVGGRIGSGEKGGRAAGSRGGGGRAIECIGGG